MDTTTITTTTTTTTTNNNNNSNTFGLIDVVLTYAAHISSGRSAAAMGNLRKRTPPCTGGGPLRLCGVRMCHYGSYNCSWSNGIQTDQTHCRPGSE